MIVNIIVICLTLISHISPALQKRALMHVHKVSFHISLCGLHRIIGDNIRRTCIDQCYAKYFLFYFTQLSQWLFYNIMYWFITMVTVVIRENVFRHFCSKQVHQWTFKRSRRQWSSTTRHIFQCCIACYFTKFGAKYAINNEWRHP